MTTTDTSAHIRYVYRIFNMLRACWQELSSLYRWAQVNVIRLWWHQGSVPSLTDLQILYLSDNYVVVNKVESIKINSDDPSELTIETQLKHCKPELVDESVEHSFRFAQRLDYSTSGAMCLALNRKSANAFGKLLEKRLVHKFYIALVRGHCYPFDGSYTQHVKLAIGKDLSVTDRCKMCVDMDPHCRSPRSAHTELFVLQYGTYSGEPATKLLLLPHTGRTHQLRVHCAYLGHRIIGDYTYSDRQDVWPYRMMLHAHRLRACLKKETIDVTARDPFVKEVDPCWVPNETIHDRDTLIEQLLRR